MSGLQTYHNKRRFGATKEPRGKIARTKGLAFVIQKHGARRLHYDLRLELDGVMKSWAVTRGPSMVPSEKRLAVQVEDHPIDYNRFEGTIPKGEYGAGTVMIWDRGKWTPDEDPGDGLRKGHLAFHLDGKKLQGGWHLVRMRRPRGGKQDNWLLIKQRDDDARGKKDKDILKQAPGSVVTGRLLEEIGEAKRHRKHKTKKKVRSKIKKAKARKSKAKKKRNRTKR